MDASRFGALLIVAVLGNSSAFCQEKNAFDLSQRVVLSNSSIRLDSLLKTISQQTGFIFSYNTRKVNHGLQFYFVNKRLSLEEILVKIQEKTRLEYSLADNHIILKSSRLVASPLKVSAIPTPLKETKKKNKNQNDITSNQVSVVDSSKFVTSKKESQSWTNVEQINSNNEKPEKTVSVLKDQGDSTKYIEPDPIIEPAKNQPLLVKFQKSKKDSVVKPNKPESTKAVNQKIKKQLAFQAKAGITADETLYLGPTIQFGIPTIYGTISYKTDFSLGLLSYGLGTSFKLGKTLNLSLQINTGSITKSYDSVRLATYDSTSAHRGINAQSNLTRIAFLIEKKITSRIILQGGLQYNLLTTRFSRTLLSEDGKRLCAIKPPYLISNTTSTTGDSNVKSWIGIQLNLLYTINFSKKK